MRTEKLLSKFKRFLPKEIKTHQIVIGIGFPSPFFRSKEKVSFVESKNWEVLDQTLEGVLIRHPRIKVRRGMTLLLLPDVSFVDKGYVVRVPGYSKTVGAARRWMYRLPRNVEWVQEV